MELNFTVIKAYLVH